MCKGILKVGAAIPAKIERTLVQISESARIVHQTVSVLAVKKIEKVTDFVQGDLGGPLKKPGGRWVVALIALCQSEQ